MGGPVPPFPSLFFVQVVQNSASFQIALGIDSQKRYNPLIEKYGLNEVTIPKRPTVFSNAQRCEEIVAELKESKASLLILLGDIPIAQFLSRVAEVPFKSLQEYVDLYGYGTVTAATVDGHTVNVLPLAHPRQIGALGAHSEKWNKLHQSWELKIK